MEHFLREVHEDLVHQKFFVILKGLAFLFCDMNTWVKIIIIYNNKIFNESIFWRYFHFAKYETQQIYPDIRYHIVAKKSISPTSHSLLFRAIDKISLRCYLVSVVYGNVGS